MGDSRISSGFSPEEQSLARRALEIFMYEINGAGLRWEFDHRPDDAQGVAWTRRYIKDHHGNPERFQGRIDRLGILVSAMERLVNRPIDEGKSLLTGRNVTRVITPEEVQAYRCLHNALCDLAAKLSEFDPDSPEVIRATNLVCCAVRTEEWHEQITEVPEGMNGRLLYAARWYLEAVFV